jgi:CheY-like chemotaxis protein
MLVDDEEDILEVVSKYLKKWNFSVDAFSDPLRALGQFKSQPDYYRLLITDMRMPGMTGLELASRIIELKPGINVVLMTAFDTDSVSLPEYALRSTSVIRRQDILRKPFRLEQVCQAVKKQLIKE